MAQLSNAQLRIDLLDPVTDRALLGPRFCWGGFIWQVHDQRLGPLLSGPEWPEPAPNPWNAQGLPESFRHRTRDGVPWTWHGNRGVAIGAGELSLNEAGEAVVVRPCEWEIASEPCAVNFHTHQRAAGFDFKLTRRIELHGRIVTSISELTNHAENPLQFEWFAHPFFALTDGLISADFPAGTKLDENPAFAIVGRTLIQKQRFADARTGHMDFLKLPEGENFSAQLNHPAISRVGFECSFVPTECVIWGNSNTFSIEPYQTLAVASGQTAKWKLQYVFGESSSMKRV
jgi:hypothetical protein